jgi:D-alanyl-D-alanine carboxypeptidase/D-alanyl-D-alanine carboxypeptidase (penicillin-binding protein 5/6)
VEQLLFALMLSSANDAAAALAYHTAGSIEGFAALMNQKAKSLGLSNTQFANPHGLDAKGHYTSAYDLACIASCALENEDFLRIVSTEKKVIPLCEQQGARVLRNHNKLLSALDGCIGVKTGFTKKSGRCLVSAAEREGVRLVCVTLDCPDDWRVHKELHEGGFAAYERVTLAAANSFAAALPVVGGVQSELYLQTVGELSITLPRQRGEITCTVNAPHFVYAPIEAGEVIGEAVWTLEGEIIAQAPLAAAYTVPRKENKRTPFSWLRKLLNILKDIL